MRAVEAVARTGCLTSRRRRAGGRRREKLLCVNRPSTWMKSNVLKPPLTRASRCGASLTVTSTLRSCRGRARRVACCRARRLGSSRSRSLGGAAAGAVATPYCRGQCGAPRSDARWNSPDSYSRRWLRARSARRNRSPVAERERVPDRSVGHVAVPGDDDLADDRARHRGPHGDRRVRSARRRVDGRRGIDARVCVAADPAAATRMCDDGRVERDEVEWLFRLEPHELPICASLSTESTCVTRTARVSVGRPLGDVERDRDLSCCRVVRRPYRPAPRDIRASSRRRECAGRRAGARCDRGTPCPRADPSA